MPAVRVTPEIRFKGFADAWKQRELGKVVEIVMGQSPDGSTYSSAPSDYILVQGNADLKNGWVEPRVWTTQLTKTANKGDLIMSVRAPAGAMGKTAYDVVLGRGVAAIKGNDFIFTTLQKYDSTGFWNKYSCGSTFDSLNSSQIENASIIIPTIEEQKRIGTYFAKMDQAISLHQRKCDALKEIKKTLLVKMFPAEGETVPEIRFKGFTDAWKQRRLDEQATIVGGGTPDTNNPKYWDGDIDWYAPAEMESMRYATSSQRKITREGLDNSSAKILPAGKTILFTSRAGIGKVAILKRDAATNQGFQSIVLKDNIDTYFVYAMGTQIKEAAEGIASGSTFLEISGKALGQLEFKFPSYIEQQSVASIFEKLDNLITLHQRKVDMLKEMKQALLAKMFV